MVRFLRIDLMVSGSSPALAKLSLRVRRESRQLSVNPGVGITRCGHIERKDLDTTHQW